MAVLNETEAQRQTRKRITFGPGFTIGELQALPASDPRVALTDSAKASVASLVASGTLSVPAAAAAPFAGRRAKVGAVFVSDWVIAYACTLDADLLAAVEAAENQYLSDTGQL